MARFYDTNLPPDLRALKEEIEGYARGYGLDFYETIFEVIDADDLNEIAAYGGFPTRYPHWSFGMAYEELKKGYDYGLSKIYEMVINNDPCYAYLMRCNHVVDQKLVMAHVYAHCDFFKNNAYFGHTSRKMMDEIANHGARIRRYVEKYGEDEVEAFLDRCMSIDDLIDIHSVAIRRRDEHSRYDFTSPAADEEGIKLTRFKSKDYMDDYVNPRGALEAEEAEARKQREQLARSFPGRPEKDVLHFLVEFAPLKPWQRDILEIVRDEAYYFTPQGQTKILNEGWACVLGHSYVLTDAGVVRAKELVENRARVQVSDGQDRREVYDWAVFRDRETVTITTRRGLKLGGSLTHQVMLPDGSWKRLDEVAVGDRLRTGRGSDLWATQPVAIDWRPAERLTLAAIERTHKVAARTLLKCLAGKPVRRQEELLPVLARYSAERSSLSVMHNGREQIQVPRIVDEDLAAFLGYLVGDGHISAVKRVIGLTTGDEPQADHFAELAERLFGLTARKKWDATKWRVLLSSRTLQDLLTHLGLETGFAARRKTVPDCILRSPRPVVAAFLRALYDCDGYAGKAGVILSTASETMSEVVQLLLLNFGILSTRRPHKDGVWHVHTVGRSAEVFGREIGFRLERKAEALRAYVEERRWFKEEVGTDEVVAVERGRADVYDFSVAETHRYVAQGLVNHNSYWHTTIMTQKVLEPSEVIDYADHHSGTVAMQRGRMNPYKLGLELLRDIEHRWDTGKFGAEYDACDDLDKKRNWNLNLGLGRKKIFEVRRVHNDITFIDTYLTPEFCREQKMFAYAFQDQPGQYVIESREFQKIKQRLLFSLTNFGKPWIYVTDGNYRNRGELLLKHEHNGIDLKLNYAQDTLTNLQFIWSRPVHLETIVDGKPTLLSFDGNEHTSKTIGEPDDARRNAPAKAR
jgi:stage V sporulation protein R